jgi:hypothetical protein
MRGDDLWLHVVSREEPCGELFCAISRRINPQLRMTAAIANLGIVCECDPKTAEFPGYWGHDAARTGASCARTARPIRILEARYLSQKRAIPQDPYAFTARLRQNKTCVPYSLLLTRENMAP